MPDRAKDTLRRRRQQIESELGTNPRRRYFSPAYYSQYEVTVPLLRRYAHGRLIDLGAGLMPYRQFIEAQVSCYDSLETEGGMRAVTFRGDIQAMPMVPSESYDTAVCLEVLEHVPDPFGGAREVWRILKPGGIFVVSVPHLSRLHLEPNDYFRFTKYGLRTLLEKAGFLVEILEQRGGLASFIGNQIATIALGLTWGMPILGGLTWFANGWLVTRLAYRLDTFVDHSGVFAMAYTAVAKKPGR